MNSHLGPDKALAKMGHVLHLAIRDESGNLSYRQFLTLRDFDYRDHLEEIRKAGAMKSEEAMDALAHRLVDKNFIAPIETQILDLGIQGRASCAIRELRESMLYPKSRTILGIANEIEANCFTFHSIDGDLHVLKVGESPTLGHVRITLDDGRIKKIVTLDIVGPESSDLPCDLDSQLRERLLDMLYQELADPKLGLNISIQVIKSDLAEAVEALTAT